MKKIECKMLLEDLKYLYPKEGFTIEQAEKDYVAICGDVASLIDIIDDYNKGAKDHLKSDSLLQHLYDNSTWIEPTNYEQNDYLDFNYHSLCATCKYLDKYSVGLYLQCIEVWSPTFENNNCCGLIGVYDFIVVE